MEGYINPMQKLALGLCVVDLVIYFSRFFDEFGGAFHLPGLILSLLIITTIASGRFFAGFTNTVGKMLLAFLVWAAVASVFSIWRSYSISSFETLLFSVTYFAVVAGLPTTYRHVRQLMVALAASFLMATFLVAIFGAARGGRMQLAVGTYHDPNQFAMCLLMGIPLWWYLAASAKTTISRTLSLLCTLPMFFVFIQTGSRGGLLGLVVMIAIYFFMVPISKKIVLAGVTIIAALVTLAFLPSYIKTRYMTFFDSSAVNLNNQTEETAFLLRADMDSAAGRKALFYKSIDITLHNPIVGVGPGNFPTAVFSQAKKNGEVYAWFVTHNAYTQISTETGIPGFLLFVLMIAYSFKNLNTVLRITRPRGQKPWPDMWNAANYLRLSLVGTSICICFLSVGYTCEVYVLAAVTVGLERALRLEMENAPPVSAAVPVVSTGFVRRPRVADRYPQESRRVKPYSL